MAQKHNEEMISAPMTRYGRLTLDAQRRQLRSDAFTAAEWTANNPILQLGELGSEKDTNKIKVGDGVTAWNDLPYSGGGSSVSSTTVTLAAADWADSAQTVDVADVTADSIVIVSPIPADQSDYTDAGILCTAQADGELTFTCDTTPTNDIDVSVVIL